MPNDSPLPTTQSPSPKNRGGAPKGNTNALKHGFYSYRFQREGLLPLNVSYPHEMKDKITFLRLLIRHYAQYSAKVASLDQDNESLRTISLACLVLIRLIRTKLLLGQSPPAEYTRLLDQAIDILTRD